jgi:peptidoglycan/LPS O-acetylase OafA/YrhL
MVDTAQRLAPAPSLEGEAPAGALAIASTATIRERYLFLDGMRGWAALAVLLYHVFIDGYPANDFARNLRWFPYLNGWLAVCLFFAISGFALSIGFINSRRYETLLRLAAGRYFRLAIPILGACSLVYVLLKLGMIPPPEKRPVQSEFLLFDPTLQHLLRFSLIDVFASYSAGETYVPPLWTMPIELLGSFIVIGTLAIVGKARNRFWVYVPLFLWLLLAKSFYSLFVAGMMSAELYVRVRPTGTLWTVFCGVAVAAASVALSFLQSEQSIAVFLWVLIAFVAVVLTDRFRSVFETRVSRFLGRISFPLYLVHAPIMWSFSMQLLLLLESSGWQSQTARLLVGALTVPVSILAAVLFAPVNEAGVQAARWVGAQVTRKPKR